MSAFHRLSWLSTQQLGARQSDGVSEACVKLLSGKILNLGCIYMLLKSLVSETCWKLNFNIVKETHIPISNVMWIIHKCHKCLTDFELGFSLWTTPEIYFFFRKQFSTTEKMSNVQPLFFSGDRVRKGGWHFYTEQLILWQAEKWYSCHMWPVFSLFLPRKASSQIYI